MNPPLRGKIKKYAKIKRFKAKSNCIKESVYIDVGKTGTNFEREGFERMMQDVRARKVDCIIVKDLSRFGRNHIETGNYIEKIFPFMGVRFIAVTDNFDSLNLSGKGEAMGVNLKNLVNEMYARDIAVKVKAGKRAKWEQGSYTGGIPAYGYRAEWVDGKKCLFVEEGTSDIVKKIYELFLSGVYINGIIRWLYENRVARPTEYHKTGRIYCQEEAGLQQWSRKTIKQILTNTIYTGCLVQGCTGGKDSRIGGQHDMDPEDWLVKEHTHEAIVSRELFLEAAEKFEKSTIYNNQKEDLKQLPEKENVFKDVFYCGECGAKMKRVAVAKRFKSKAFIRLYSYKCPGFDRIDRLKCEAKSITMESLMEIVRETLRQEFMLSGIRLQDLEEINKQEAEKRKEEWNGQLTVTERKLEGIRKTGSELYLKYRAGEIGAEKFKEGKAENDEKAASLCAKSRDIAEKLRKIDSEMAGNNHFLRALVRGSGTSEWSGEVVRTLFERIEVYPGNRVELVFAFKQSELLTGEEGRG